MGGESERQGIPARLELRVVQVGQLERVGEDHVLALQPVRSVHQIAGVELQELAVETAPLLVTGRRLHHPHPEDHHRRGVMDHDVGAGLGPCPPKAWLHFGRLDGAAFDPVEVGQDVFFRYHCSSAVLRNLSHSPAISLQPSAFSGARASSGPRVSSRSANSSRSSSWPRSISSSAIRSSRADSRSAAISPVVSPAPGRRAFPPLIRAPSALPIGPKKNPSAASPNAMPRANWPSSLMTRGPAEGSAARGAGPGAAPRNRDAPPAPPSVPAPLRARRFVPPSPPAARRPFLRWSDPWSRLFGGPAGGESRAGPGTTPQSPKRKTAPRRDG